MTSFYINRIANTNAYQLVFTSKFEKHIHYFSDKALQALASWCFAFLTEEQRKKIIEDFGEKINILTEDQRREIQSFFETRIGTSGDYYSKDAVEDAKTLIGWLTDEDKD